MTLLVYWLQYEVVPLLVPFATFTVQYAFDDHGNHVSGHRQQNGMDVRQCGRTRWPNVTTVIAVNACSDFETVQKRFHFFHFPPWLLSQYSSGHFLSALWSADSSEAFAWIWAVNFAQHTWDFILLLLSVITSSINTRASSFHWQPSLWALSWIELP